MSYAVNFDQFDASLLS